MSESTLALENLGTPIQTGEKSASTEVPHPLLTAEKPSKTITAENLHSLENFPDKVKELVEKDMLLVDGFCKKWEGRVTALGGAVDKLLTRVKDARNVDKEELSGSQEDEDLFNDLYKVRTLWQDTGVLPLQGRNLFWKNCNQFVRKYGTEMEVKEMAVVLQARIPDTSLGGRLRNLRQKFSVEKSSDDSILTEKMKMLAESVARKQWRGQKESEVAQAAADGLVKAALEGKNDEELLWRKATESYKKLASKRNFAWAFSDLSRTDVSRWPAVESTDSFRQLLTSSVKNELGGKLQEVFTQMQKDIVQAGAQIKEGKGNPNVGVSPYDEPPDFIRTVWTPTEMNEKYERAVSLCFQIGRVSGKASAGFGLEAEHLKVKGIEPVTREDYEELAAISLRLANSKETLHHGVSKSKVRKDVLDTMALLSHVAQERHLQRSNFNTGEMKGEDLEGEQVCFSLKRVLAQYANLGDIGGFDVAVPAAEIFQNCGFFEADGTHVFGKVPKVGFEYDLNTKPGVIVLDKRSELNLRSEYGEDYVAETKRKWGEKLMVRESVEFAYTGDLDWQDFPKAKLARIVPTGVLMDTPSTKRDGMVYKLVYML